MNAWTITNSQKRFREPVKSHRSTGLPMHLHMVTMDDDATADQLRKYHEALQRPWRYKSRNGPTRRDASFATSPKRGRSTLIWAIIAGPGFLAGVTLIGVAISPFLHRADD